LTIWYCILIAELIKTHSFRLLFFGDFDMGSGRVHVFFIRISG